MSARCPRLLLPVQWPQDVPLLAGIAQACRRDGRLAVVISVPWQLVVLYPWVAHYLLACQAPVQLTDRSLMQLGLRPRPEQFDAVLTASESTAGAHRVLHALVRRANTAGVPTFTMQHGLENVGLTLEDAKEGPVDFASRHIFTWIAPERLPGFVGSDVRRRCEGVGRVRAPAIAEGSPSMLNREPLVLVGENLHWSRYSEIYRQAFLDGIARLALSREDLGLLVRRHPAGHWLKTAAMRLRELPNVTCEAGSLRWRRERLDLLLGRASAVITSPSTLALDAAEAGVPVAVVGGAGLSLAAYQPLPVLTRPEEWPIFMRDPDSTRDKGRRFVQSATIPGDGAQRVVARIATTLV